MNELVAILLDGVKAQVLVWPSKARVLWFLVRPLCTLAALLGCALSGEAVVAAVGGALAVLVIRPTRSPWLSPLLAAAVYFVSPLAAIAVVLRTAAGVVAVLLMGRTWRTGLAVVRRGRRALIGSPHPLRVEKRLWDGLRGEDTRFDFFDLVVELWLSVWATADMTRLARVTVELASGVLFWNWNHPTGPSFTVRLLRIGFSETLIRRTSRIAAVAVSVGLVVLLGVPEPTSLLGLSVPSWVAVVPAALWTWSYTKRAATTRPPISWTVLTVVVSFVLYGPATVQSLACAVAVVLPTRSVTELLANRLLGSRRIRLRLPWFVGGPITRDLWTSAETALSSKRYRVASRLWAGLAEDESSSPTVKAASYAALTHVHLIAGAVQDAVVSAEKALAVTGAERVREQVCGTAGRAFLAAGDDDRAGDLLDRAASPGRRGADPLVDAARAQVAARYDFDKALVHLGKSAGGMVRSGNLFQLIDSEVAVVTRLVGHAPPEALQERLLQLLSFDEETFLQANVPGRAQVDSAIGRARLLLGRLQLDDGKPGSAVENLRHAINGLPAPADAFDQAVARILLGAALNRGNRSRGLPELTLGVRGLESLRGELAMGRHRNQLIDRHADVYRAALDAVERLQPDHGDAGMLAFELVESLRRNALARTLRERNLDLGTESELLQDRIKAIEARGRQPEDDAELRRLEDRMTLVVSSGFASAYLPEPVEVGEVRAALGSAHCLVYQFAEFGPDLVRGHLVWLSPDGDAVVAGVHVSDPALLRLLDDDVAARSEVLAARQSSATEVDRWRGLGAALLPQRLRLLLEHAAEPLNLVVVPGAELSALPWAALRLDDDSVLLESAVIQLVPALAVLDGGPSTPVTRRGGVAYLDPGLETTTEQLSLRHLGCEIVESRESMLASLRTGMSAGLYVAAHGEGVGLTQHMLFDDGSRLSAATALTVPWPPWIVFASCFVGNVRVKTGDDPLGLPISCLLGGANAVIGGIIGVNSVAAGTLCPDIARGLLAGEHPAVALREAQLAYLRSRRTMPSPARWAGFVCISRRVAALDR